jgi:hypothetical protein
MKLKLGNKYFIKGHRNHIYTCKRTTYKMSKYHSFNLQHGEGMTFYMKKNGKGALIDIEAVEITPLHKVFYCK